jgi:hypothetical protein
MAVNRTKAEGSCPERGDPLLAATSVSGLWTGLVSYYSATPDRVRRARPSWRLERARPGVRTWKLQATRCR